MLPPDARCPILPGNGSVTAPPRLPPPITSRCHAETGEPPRASPSVENSRSCSDRRTRRSAERASTEVREGAMCVQRLDDSLNSAIRTTYRSSLRSSSKHEPRGPPLEVVLSLLTTFVTPRFLNKLTTQKNDKVQCTAWLPSPAPGHRGSPRTRRADHHCGGRRSLLLLFDSRH